MMSFQSCFLVFVDLVAGGHHCSLFIILFFHGFEFGSMIADVIQIVILCGSNDLLLLSLFYLLLVLYDARQEAAGLEQCNKHSWWTA